MTDHHKSRASTHAQGCWGWGPRHYECALEYASDLTKPVDLQGCDCPICTSIAALRERLGEKE